MRFSILIFIIDILFFNVNTNIFASSIKKDNFIYTGLSDIIEHILPSVVYITNDNDDISFNNKISGFKEKPDKSIIGSGFIFDEHGFVVTNYHVISDLDIQNIFVVDYLNKKNKAELVGFDKNFDLAVLKINNKEGQLFKSVKFNLSKNYKIGDFVVSIGNQFGLGISSSFGIISALNRDVFQQGIDLIQTDAAMNFGSSGGVCIDMSGEVIGVNVAIVSSANTTGNVGISFALPADVVYPIVSSLKDGKSMKKGFMGITMQALDDNIINHFNLRDTLKPNIGVMVVNVKNNSPAQMSNIKIGDIIIAINGIDVKNPIQLSNIIARMDKGQEANFTLLRKKDNIKWMPSDNKQDKFVTMNLKTIISYNDEYENYNVKEKIIPNIGLYVKYLFNNDNNDNILVVSNAYKKSLSPGDIITAFSIDGREIINIKNEKDFNKFIEYASNMKDKDNILVFVKSTDLNFSVVLGSEK